MGAVWSWRWRKGLFGKPRSGLTDEVGFFSGRAMKEGWFSVKLWACEKPSWVRQPYEALRAWKRATG